MEDLLFEIIRKFSSTNNENFISDEVERVLDWSKKNNCVLLNVKENGPISLKNIDGAPKLLFVIGNLDILFQNCVAIVGTRRPTTYGVHAALKFSKALAENGMVIVSGLANGIDTCSHKGALSVNGFTIAVLGSGLDYIYPRLNKKLSQEILEKNGALISEYPPFVKPQKHFFPQRNRIISGLSDFVLVVEAPAKSGALITASFAIEQGRDVFVVPGQFDDENFIGNHNLIQQGAKLVYKLEDILEEVSLNSNDSESLSVLKKIFRENGNSLTLSELFSKSGFNLGVLMELLDSCINNGLIFEVSPQKYVLVS